LEEHSKLLSEAFQTINLTLSPKIERALEALAMVFVATFLTYAYTAFLSGLPYGLLTDLHQVLKRDFEVLKYCWISDELGKPNDRLAFATICVLPAFMRLLGADLNAIGFTLLLTLWVLGGCPIYILAKRFSGSRLAGLTAMLIYLGSAVALRGLWHGLEASALYVLTPLVLLVVDEAYKRGSISYGFYTALASTLLSGALIKLGNLTALTLTVLAYFIVRTRGKTLGLKWMVMFLTLAGFSWLIMNAWWIATPPGLNVEGFSPLCLTVFPIAASTFLLLFEAGKLSLVQALAVVALVVVLMDPQTAVSSNVTPDVSAITSTCISLLVALGAKRFSERLSDYISVSLVIDEDCAREYDLVKPFIFLLVSGIVVYQGLTIPLSWTSSLNVPEQYEELSQLLQLEDCRVLTMPITSGEFYYGWSDRKYEKPVENLILDNPIVYGDYFKALNNLTGRAEFWKVLSALDAGFIMLHYDIDWDRVQAVNPWLIEARLNYSFIVSPNLVDGAVNVSSEDVEPITRDLGFIQVVNFNPERHYEAEARYIEVEEAQSEIHLYACGESWTSEQPAFNGTFSFAYTLPAVSNWLEYNYLEFWIKVNGSNTADIQIQDAFGRWAVWRLDLREQSWNLATVRLSDATLDIGLDRSRVVAIVFSMHAPPGGIVEAEVGGIFLDKGVEAEVTPLELFVKFDQQFTVYRLRDEFKTSKIYLVKEALRYEGDIFENLLKSEFDPKSKAYVEDAVMQVSHTKLDYIEENPTYYKVTVDYFQDRILIVLNEWFDPGWRLYIGDPNLVDILTGTEQQDVKHVKVNGFFNGWYIENGEEKPLTITIVYRPQLLMEMLRAVSMVFAISGFIIISLLGRRFTGMLKHIRPYGEKT
jgi:hypothetical protein